MGKSRKAPLDVGAAQELIDRASSSDGATVLRYHCTLVTPMYGGGVVAGEVDLAMPIRATAIRGQLREWWRRLNRKEDDKELFKAEREIWGGLGGDADTLAASKVTVVVLAQAATASNLRNIARFEQRDGKMKGPTFEKGLPGYALFPGQGKSERGQVTEQPKQLLTEGYSFAFGLRFGRDLASAQREQIVEALRWWATFGGVGARTRRGCGAVLVKDSSGKLVAVDQGEIAEQGWMLKLRGLPGTAMEAWDSAVSTLRVFRQGKGQGRNKGKENRPGRSLWPEPDAIRRITSSAASQHKQPFCDAGNAFPRAEFGLPIIFHFKDERDGDPADTTLKPLLPGIEKPAERMASPLILRPYPASADGKRWQAAALCMGREHVKAMGLVLEGKSRAFPKAMAAGTWCVSASHIEKIKPITGRPHAIEAFLEYFSSAAGQTNQAGKAPTRPTGTQGVAGVQLSLRPNGSLVAFHQHTKKTWSVTAAKVEALLTELPTPMRDALKVGKSVAGDIEIAGNDIIRVREKA